MGNLEVRGERGNYVSIEVIGPMHGTDKPQVPDWLDAIVAVRVPPFSCEFRALFEFEELVRFSESLGVVLQQFEGVVEFQSYEYELSLSITLNSMGHATVMGRAVYHSTADTALNFSFPSDQTYLRQTQQQVTQLISVL